MDRLNNKLYRLIVIWILFCVSGSSVSFAQENKNQPISATNELEAVEILASRIHKFGVGANINTIDSTVLAHAKHTSLSQILSTQSTVFIKQYGPGMLASIAFRGTGAAHTTILWNGMQIGYPSLGQADLSLISIDFIDEISLVHGSASARFGTGAIGGTVDLTSRGATKGFSVLANQSIGSFGTSNSSLQISNGGERGFLKIGGFFKKSNNNFPYKSSNGKPLGTQENANFSISGVKMDAKLILNKRNSFDFNVQATHANRNIQSSIGSSAINNQKDKNIWSSFAYNHFFENAVATLQYGFLYDKINYNRSTTFSTQHKFNATIEYDIAKNIVAELGANTTLVEVNTPFYNNGLASETRANLFASIRWNVLHRLNMSLNLRQAYVTGYKIPFTPALGLDFQALNSTHWQLNVVGQLARGYRVPTLNDRFWVPGGNINIKPEESVNAEIGVKLKNKGDTPYWIKGTTYQLWVDDWILWMPNGAFWSPGNIRKVKGFGVEFESGIEKQFGKLHVKGWLNYAYTKSTNQEALDKYDRSVGKQLPYVPFHNGNITGQVEVGQWQLQANLVITSKRFITADNETQVPGYGLLNLQTSYKFYFQEWRIRTFMEVNNTTNTNYQSIINRAMPGINFLVGANVHFNKKRKDEKF